MIIYEQIDVPILFLPGQGPTGIGDICHDETPILVSLRSRSDGLKLEDETTFHHHNICWNSFNELERRAVKGVDFLFYCYPGWSISTILLIYSIVYNVQILS